MMDKTIVSQIFATLKKIRKDKGVSFDELGEHLGVSSRTVQRIFSDDDVSIKKLVNICEYFDLDFFTLIELSKSKQLETMKLTKAQDEFLANNLGHYRILSSLLSHPPSEVVEKLKEELSLSDVSMNRYLKDLDEVGLIVRKPRNCVELAGNAKSIGVIPLGKLWKEIFVSESKALIKRVEDDQCDVAITLSAFASEETLAYAEKEFTELRQELIRRVGYDYKFVEFEKMRECFFFLGINKDIESFVDNIPV